MSNVSIRTPGSVIILLQQYGIVSQTFHVLTNYAAISTTGVNL